MDRGALFLDTFFKPDLIVRYLPDILKGMVVTIEIALLVVVAGIALGLALALVRSLRSRLLNLPIIVFVDVARTCRRSSSSSSSISACPMWGSSSNDKMSFLRLQR